METINNGTYTPLSRPVFIYIRSQAKERPEVDAFVRFYLEHAKTLAADVGYVALPDALYTLALQRYAKGVLGSVFGDASRKGESLESLLRPSLP